MDALHPIPIPSDSSEVSDDEPPSTKDPDFAPGLPSSKLSKPLKRKRCNADADVQVLPNTDAVKEHLQQLNTDCTVRIRSSTSKQFRFCCKNQGKGCTLNLNAHVCTEGLSFVKSAYTPGSCGRVTCVYCLESIPNVVQAVSCSKGHLFCDSCFSTMVEEQVFGGAKAAFMGNGHNIACTAHGETAETRCGAFFDIRQNSQRLQPAVWTRYLEAVTESAVVLEQQKLKPLVLAATGPPSELEELLNHISTIVLPRCTVCQRFLPDFDGCLALVCGRTVNHAEGLGCGSHCCAYCQHKCEDEWSVHEHLKSCAWNPRPNNMFPRNDVKEIQYAAARERIWTHIVLKCKVENVAAAFTSTDARWPELGMSKQWCDQRLAWNVLASEMQLDPLQFSEELPKYMRCAAQCVEMGFADGPAKRASVLYRGDVTQACITLLADSP